MLWIVAVNLAVLTCRLVRAMRASGNLGFSIVQKFGAFDAQLPVAMVCSTVQGDHPSYSLLFASRHPYSRRRQDLDGFLFGEPAVDHPTGNRFNAWEDKSPRENLFMGNTPCVPGCFF